MKKIFLLLFVLFSFTSCSIEKRIDASSEGTMQKSIAAVMKELQPPEQDKFEESLKIIMFSGIKNFADIAAMGQNTEIMKGAFQAKVDGKTAQEIIQLAESIKNKRKGEFNPTTLFFNSEATMPQEKNSNNKDNTSQITQFPAGVSNTIIRMVIAGTSVNELRFNVPSEFDNLGTPSIGVFHPSGGDAIYIAAPADIMASATVGDWVFNGNMEVPNLGTNGVDGNDIIAFLVGVKQSICKKINEEHGLGSTIPVLNGDRSSSYTKRMVDDGTMDYVLPTTDMPDIDDGSGSFEWQPFGCFQNAGGGDYVYYHVVVER